MATAKQARALDASAPSEVTPAQIEDWKQKYGKVFTYESTDGKTCYLRQPTRRIIAAATVNAGSDQFLQNELVLKNCFLGGDRDLLDQDKYFFFIQQKVSDLIDVVEGTLKEA